MTREDEAIIAMQRPAIVRLDDTKTVHYYRSDRNFDTYILYDDAARISLGTFAVKHQDYLLSADRNYFLRQAARTFLRGYSPTQASENARLISRAMQA